KGAGARPVPAHTEAADVHRERAGRRLREQPAPRRRARPCRGGGCRGGAGVKEVRAWTIKRGFTAPQAAGVIHTDFERGFIRAETVGYDDFIQYKGEQ